ncbi:hypothetical protein LCGC14_1534370 [marine sediment metagenome]|uniref:Uncharacterized protein n=1 Tax=marine sediment metagenome TaxID=412755 RepID=A0A0F9JFT3_9ZZZZ
MIEIQNYLNALLYIIVRTNILQQFGWTLAISMLLGALFLDRFKVLLWSVFLVTFLVLTQWQISTVMQEWGLTAQQIAQPHIITVISGLLFTIGSGTGYAIKKRCTLAYTKESPEVVAKEIIKKVNGGAMENSNVPN